MIGPLSVCIENGHMYNNCLRYFMWWHKILLFIKLIFITEKSKPEKVEEEVKSEEEEEEESEEEESEEEASSEEEESSDEEDDLSPIERARERVMVIYYSLIVQIKITWGPSWSHGSWICAISAYHH